MDSKKKILVTAFTFSGSGIFNDPITGGELPKNFEGFCEVYSKHPQPAPYIFRTGIDPIGERYWQAIGDKDKLNIEYPGGRKEGE